MFIRFCPILPSLVASSAFALCTLGALAQTPTSSSVPCSTGTAAFYGQNQSGKVTTGSPFSIQLNASVSGSGCNITYVRLYADNKAVQGYAVSAPSGGFNFRQISLADGYHNLVGVAYDQDGYSFRTPNFSLFVANEDLTVYLNWPQNGAILTSTDVHFDVRTRWDNRYASGGTQVTHVRVYVDNKDIYDSNASYVDFYKTLSPGTHTAVAVAWNSTGNHIQSSSTFTVK